MTAVKITASAGYLPEKVVTNDELSQLMDTSDEWIVSHTGIKKRHYAIAENTSDLATKVAQKLLQQAKLDATQIDLIIVSTITPDALTPATAAIVQKISKLATPLRMTYPLRVRALSLPWQLLKNLSAAGCISGQWSSVRKLIPRCWTLLIGPQQSFLEMVLRG